MDMRKLWNLMIDGIGTFDIMPDYDPGRPSNQQEINQNVFNIMSKAYQMSIPKVNEELRKAHHG